MESYVARGSNVISMETQYPITFIINQPIKKNTTNITNLKMTIMLAVKTANKNRIYVLITNIKMIKWMASKLNIIQMEI